MEFALFLIALAGSAYAGPGISRMNDSKLAAEAARLSRDIVIAGAYGAGSGYALAKFAGDGELGKAIATATRGAVASQLGVYAAEKIQHTVLANAAIDKLKKSGLAVRAALRFNASKNQQIGEGNTENNTTVNDSLPLSTYSRSVSKLKIDK